MCVYKFTRLELQTALKNNMYSSYFSQNDLCYFLHELVYKVSTLTLMS